MSLAAVGSIAFDSVRSPFGEVEGELGGSAVYAAIAASFFTEVRIVGPVGGDFDGWRPRLSAAARSADILFLGAMDPEVQLDVRGQWDGAKWVALDTLGYW